MINKKFLQSVIDEEIAKKELFLVSFSVSPNNKITLFVDSIKGVTISDCATLSKNIEDKLNRDKEDFELEVSSSGIGKPFKVKEQYIKNKGRKVEIVTNNGLRQKGILIGVKGDSIEMFVEIKEKSKGKKTRKTQQKRIINFKDIKTTKEILKI